MQRLVASSLLRQCNNTIRPSVFPSRGINYPIRSHSAYSFVPIRPVIARQKETRRARSISEDMEQASKSTPQHRWLSYVEEVRSRTEPKEARRHTLGIHRGRTVKVEGGRVGNAFLHLDKMLKQNNIWREIKMNARHVQKGEKRRKLRSLRWRRRFKREVAAKVRLVQAIRRRKA